MNQNSSAVANSATKLFIAEDDLDDQLLIREALQESGVSESDIVFAADGMELLELLQSHDFNPALIILDLNMPKMDGREVLREIKNSDQFCHIPVVIFTTSSNQDDVSFAYRSGGNTFFTKPALFDELVETMKTITKYWFEKAVLPN
ncbi:response regulator [Ketobacter sp. MCCC 1A13808]|uniref:response regulator n=1 Tax=Ketobacter sp. MCCC 1A13808 TaxID=2602738 RepID=UPI0012EB6E82|nr:response regulator [Ketobacter sp. MCCC 1A13808]MVF13609.1 response regulator [Ketobacter sp. MCCC 1A13808]